VERLASAANRVTPSDGLLFESENQYFAGHRVPPAGLENSSSAALPATVAAWLHVPTQADIDRWLDRGHFATVLLEGRDARVESLRLSRLYARREDLQAGEMCLFSAGVSR
jgi:hypothetical protein